MTAAEKPVAEFPFAVLPYRTLVLTISSDYETTGVRHKDIEWIEHGTLAHGCADVAHVSPELDCVYCSTCHWQCRISGAWFISLILVRNAASKVYDDEGVAIWMTAKHKQWNGRTVNELLHEGRLDEVLTALEGLASGAFS